MTATWRWMWVGVLALAIGAGIAVQRQRVKQARAELELAREQRREWRALVAENERMRKQQETSAEQAERMERTAELGRITVEIERRRAEVERNGDVARAKTMDTWERGAAEWKHAGVASPRAALETALWAAAGGEIDVLSGLLEFDAAARERALRLQAEVPGSAGYGPPERLFAMMTAREVSPGSARLVSETQRGEEAELRVRLTGEDGAANSVTLTMRRTPAGWKFVVPERAVERYAAMLKAGGA